MYAPLFLTIPLLLCMGYFFMGSLPLLVLNHDSPLDSRFIRGFFNTYYLAVIFTAPVAAISYAMAGRLVYAVCLFAIFGVALALRKVVLTRMDLLRIRLEHPDAAAIADFRQLHVAGMGVNFVQLVALVWGLFQFSV